MWMQLFGAIAQGGSALMNGQANYASAKMDSAQAAYDGDQAEQQGQEQSALLRRVGRRMLGAQRAGFATAGVQVGQGSAEQVERETITDTEHDAFQALLAGHRARLQLQTQARLNKIAAKAAFISALVDPLMASGGAGQALSGWKTKRPDPTLNAGNSYTGIDGSQYANNDLSGTQSGSGD